MLSTWFNHWQLFCILFGLMLVVAFFMSKQSRQFYTKDVVVRKFSIMELQFPAYPKELANLIRGLFLLPAEQSKKAITALKGQLILDFVFMPLAYGAVFTACWRVAYKIEHRFGFYVFMALAFFQLIAWACDIAENIYLLKKLHSTVTPAPLSQHNNYLLIQAIKWGGVLIAAVSTLSAVCYFWLTGNYSLLSLQYLLVVFAEIILFLLAHKLLLKN